MLQSIEVLAGSRRALRRAVQVECRVISAYWDEPVAYTASELSPQGMWIDTPYPLSLGDPLVVTFRPPNYPDKQGMFLLARVRRVLIKRRADEDQRSGMGIQFVSLMPDEERALATALVGLPPPIPDHYRKPRRELLWVDVLTERLGVGALGSKTG